MPKKTIKQQAEEQLEELKEKGVIKDFTPIEVICIHQNQEDLNGVIKCVTCGEYL